jgi:chromatin remodeling complex protein RSC6
MNKAAPKTSTVKKTIVKVKSKAVQKEKVTEPVAVTEPDTVSEPEVTVTEPEPNAYSVKESLSKLVSSKTSRVTETKKQVTDIKALLKEFALEHKLKNTKDLVDKLLEAPNKHLLELKQEILHLKSIIKTHDSELKNSKPKTKRKVNPNRVRSGIDKPVPISEEMFKFLEPYGVKSGELVAMTTALKHISTYIKEHSLQNPEFRREIILDKSLQDLFSNSVEKRDPANPKSENIYTYTRIMTYILRHFKLKSNEPTN